MITHDSSTTGRTAIYMLEQIMTGLTPVDVRSIERALRAAILKVSTEGSPVRCFRVSYVPSQQRWICFFVSDSVASVRRVAELAHLTYPRISEVVIGGPGAGQDVQFEAGDDLRAAS